MSRTIEQELHAAWLSEYSDAVVIASAGYPEPLTEDQRCAYELLPGLISRCKESWEEIPEDLRPMHYLLSR
jgi:hypothetical protein